MVTTLAEPREASGSRDEAPRGLVIRIERVPWEPLVAAALFAVALIMRLWDLDGRAYHYDESIHAFDSWALFQGGSYIHSPWSHGPLLYMLSAGGFFLFGDNLVAPRVIPALFGAALVLMPWLLRGHLGKWGALAASAILAFSPSIFYFSRFVRNDILTLVFELGLVIAVWRYIDTRHNRWLLAGAVMLVLAFSSKETTFIAFGSLTSFLFIWWLSQWWWSRSDTQAETPVPEVALEGGPGPGIDGGLDVDPLEAPPPPPPRPSLRGRVAGISPQGGLLLFLLALALPLFASGVGIVIDAAFGLNTVETNVDLPAGRVGAPDGSVGNYVAAGLTAGGLFAISAVAGFIWKRWVWLGILVVFWTIFFLLHTTFLTNMVGMGTGVWQSLGYWIAQQEVERAGQPWYYYLMQLSLYEFLPFFFGIVAVIAYVIKRGPQTWLATIIVVAAAGVASAVIYTVTDGKALYVPLILGLMAWTFVALRRGSPFDWFLVYWAMISLLLYIVAGEKMPWLLTHMALPFALLAAKFIGDIVSSVQWDRALKSGGILLLFSAPLLLFALFAMTTAVPWDFDPIGSWSFTGPLAATLAMVGAGIFLWRRLGTAGSAQMLSLSLLALMAVFTIRASLQVTYVNPDDPKELFLYSQISPDVPAVADRVEAIAEQSGDDLEIFADTAHAQFAPWRWYFRSYDNVHYIDATIGAVPETADIVVLASPNRGKINPVEDRFGEGERITFNQWFNPWGYRGYDAGDFFGDVTSARQWNRLLRLFAYREFGPEPATDASFFFVAKELQ